MIGVDQPLALVVMKRGIVVRIYYLGYCVLESGEIDRLTILVESKGMSLYLTQVEEVASYPLLYRDIGNYDPQ